MTDIPADGVLADAGDELTTANAKLELEKLRDVLAEKPGGAASSELTISSGNITPVGFLHTVDTESDASTDDLANIITTNHPETRLLLLVPEDAGRTVVVKDQSGGAGQVHTSDGNDFSMDETDKSILLYRDGTDWYEWGRSFGNSLDDFRTYLGLGTAATHDVGTSNGEVCEFDATGYPANDGSQITGIKALGDYICLQDQKSNGTQGGTFTQGAWRTRDLNVEVEDEGGDCTLASNQFTLAAGDYYINASAPGYNVNYHKIRLHESTGTISDIIGTNAFSHDGDSTQTRSTLMGKFTVSSAHVDASQNIFEIQHYCSTTQTSSGFGVSNPFGVIELYTTVELWKL